MRALLQLSMLWVLLAPMGAWAAPVLDQVNLPGSGALVAHDGWQQEVVAGSTGQLTGIDVFTSWDADDISFGLNLGGPWQTDVDDFAASGLSSVSGEVSIDLSAADIFIDAGDSFVFWAASDATDLLGTTTDAYAGELWGSGAPFSSGQWDLSFRTYVDTAQVAEPGTLALLGIGLASLGLVRRNRAP